MSAQPASKYHLTEDQQHLFNRAMWIMVGVVIGGLLFSDKEGYLTNVFTEFAGVLATVFVIDFWVRQRDARQGIEREKERLLRGARSPENSVAKHAVHEMGEHGWLADETSLLQKANLAFANLQGAELGNANLQQADLTRANLQEANLARANLQRAFLWTANLQGAILWNANLQGADLSYTELQGADLQGAELQGAFISEATEFDETTLLPDAILIDYDDASDKLIYTPGSYYQHGVTDMRKYTDPEHPEFWQPEWAKEKNAQER